MVKVAGVTLSYWFSARKAVVAFLVALVGAVGLALQTDGGMDQTEFWSAMGLALVTGAGTYAAPKNAEDRDGTDHDEE